MLCVVGLCFALQHVSLFVVACACAFVCVACCSRFLIVVRFLRCCVCCRLSFVVVNYWLLCFVVDCCVN